MKITLLTFITILTSIMAQAQIQNVSESNGQILIEQEANYRTGSRPTISLREAYLAGWNSQIVVVVHNVTRSSDGQARIYDHKGNIKNPSDLGMMPLTDAKLTVTSNGIVINKNGNTYNYDLNGKRK